MAVMFELTTRKTEEGEKKNNNFELKQELVVGGGEGSAEGRGGEIFINLLNTFHVQIL